MNVISNAVASRVQRDLEQLPVLTIAMINTAESFPSFLISSARNPDRASAVLESLNQYEKSYRLNSSLKEIKRIAQATVSRSQVSHGVQYSASM